MMAASARMSGTTLPESSNLKRGSMASRRAAACWAGPARAGRARVLVVRAAVVEVDFLTAGVFAVEAVVFFWADARTAALDCAGRPIVATIATQQKSLDAG